jgi:hypothetical protein
MRNPHTSALLRKQGYPTASVAAYDGRDQVGVVWLAYDGSYIAKDASGRIVGRFESLRQAVCALAKDLQRPASTLIALSEVNDPFYVSPKRSKRDPSHAERQN